MSGKQPKEEEEEWGGPYKRSPSIRVTYGCHPANLATRRVTTRGGFALAAYPFRGASVPSRGKIAIMIFPPFEFLGQIDNAQASDAYVISVSH